MSFKILVTTQMMLNDQDRFRAWLGDFGCDAEFVESGQFLTEEMCLNIANIYDGWISGDDQITSKVIDHFLPKLKVISKWGSGIDSIDANYAAKVGLALKYSPGAFKDSVGEMAVGYLLALTRGIVRTHIDIMGSKWPKRPARTLNNLEVGIVGLGAIGEGVASRLNALGCQVSYCDPNVDRVDYKKQDLSELLLSNEAVIITCDLNDATRGLFDVKRLAEMRNDAYLINVSRGPIIEEEALIGSLSEGKFSGVALDVYEVEPLSDKNLLRSFPNVVFGSHNANNTVDATEYVHRNTIESLFEILKRI